MTETLLPIDVEQCQALVPNGNTFMTLGGKPGLIRCKNKPGWIATENEITPEGRSSMSLCNDCKEACNRQMPNQVTFQPIGREE